MALIPKVLASVGVMLALAQIGRADDAPPSGDLERQRLNNMIAVLRLRPDAAGQSCLNALKDVHTTEEQVKTLQSRAKDPDAALAQDVLETYYENAVEICGADARHLCAKLTSSSELQRFCSAMREEHSTR